MCFKAYKKWMEKKIKLLKFWDFPLIKLSTGAFFLMIAKLWPPLLSLDWYWYLIIAVVVALPVMYKMFK